ncbi:hypothetical protein TURU_100104 [Turdus rufiventris]|nr:hypothetical protein TURU_100104 [Turdus rufiventris]
MIDPREEKENPGKDELARDMAPNLTVQTSRGRFQALMIDKESDQILFDAQNDFIKIRQIVISPKDIQFGFLSEKLRCVKQGKMINSGIECPLSRFANGIKLCGRDVIQRDLDNLER